MATAVTASVTISTGRAWFAVFVLMLAYALGMVDRTILFLMVEPIQRDLGISDTQMGLLQGFAFAAFNAIAGVPLGRLADLISRRLVIGVGIVLWSIATGFSGLARNFLDLFLARVAVGVGEAALLPAAYSMMADLFSKKRLATAIAVFSMGALAASGAAFLFGGLLINMVGTGSFDMPFFGPVRGWQATFFAAGLPGFVVALLMFAIPEPVRPGTPGAANVPVKALLAFLGRARRPVSLHFTGYTCLTLLIYATLSWVPSLLVRRHHLEPTQVGGVMAMIVGVFGVVGYVVAALLSDYFIKRGRRDVHLRVALIGALGLLPFAALATLTESIGVAVTCLCVVFMCLTIPPSVGLAAMQLMTPYRLRAQVSSLYGLMVNLVGMGTGPFMVGALTDHVYGDKADVNLSLLTVYILIVPVIVIAYWFGMKPVADWVERQETVRAEI